MINNRYLINDNAILTGIIYNIITSTIGLVIYFQIQKYIPQVYLTLLIFLIIILILIFQIRYVKLKIIILLISSYSFIKEYSIKIIKFMTVKPFRLFTLSALSSVFMILYFIFQFPDFKFIGLDLSANTSINTENTFALTIVATLIPFVFAVLTYAKTHLSSLLPSRVVSSCFDKSFAFASVLLAVIYIVSALIPILKISPSDNKIFQILLVVFTFLSTSFFVYGAMIIANKQTALKYFRLTEVETLKKIIVNDMPHASISGVQLYRFVKINLLGIIHQTYKNTLLSVPPSQALNVAKPTVDTFMIILRNSLSVNCSVEEFEFELNELAIYVSDYYLCINNYSHQYTDPINDYLFPELSTLIDDCTANETEKYLNSIIPALKVMVFQAFEVYNNDNLFDFTRPVIGSWISFLNERLYKSSNVKNSSFPLDIISFLGDITSIEIRSRYSSYNNIQILKNIGKNFCNSKVNWHKTFIQQTFFQFNKIIISYIGSWFNNPIDDNNFIENMWFDSYSSVLDELFKKAVDIDFSYNCPLLPINNSLNKHSLLWAYFSIASDLTNRENLERIKKLMPVNAPLAGEYRVWKILSDLNSIHSIFIKQLYKGNIKSITHKSTVFRSIVELFYIDFIVISSTGHNEFYKEWQKLVILQYKLIFDKLGDLINSEDNIISDSEIIEYMISIPAIALTYSHDNNKEFADEIITNCINVLISKFYEKNDKQVDVPNQSVRQYLLLVSCWLNSTGRLPNLKSEIEKFLTKHPFQTSTSRIRFQPILYKYGLPSHMNSYDKVWWLFPSYFWPDNIIQYKIEDYLMKSEDLISYAKNFTGDLIDDIDDNEFE